MTSEVDGAGWRTAGRVPSNAGTGHIDVPFFGSGVGGLAATNDDAGRWRRSAVVAALQIQQMRHRPLDMTSVSALRWMSSPVGHRAPGRAVGRLVRQFSAVRLMTEAVSKGWLTMHM